MKYLLQEDGLRVLDAFCFSEPLMAFDYDGTLAPIVASPTDARMRVITRRFLQEIAGETSVAVISGRARGDVLQFLPHGIEYVVGNHGLEGLPGGSFSLDQAAKASSKWLSKLTPQLAIEGIWIEDKKYSLSVHYRGAGDKREAKSKILEAASGLQPSPRIIMGKYVVNLVSSGAPHKGVALLELMLKSGHKSAIYFGDDDNDEDVFRLGEESLLTVRIGKSQDSSAQFFLKDQSEIDRVLKHCAAALQRTKELFKNSRISH
jgi:trehalose 6-phosphate phosphatase